MPFYSNHVESSQIVGLQQTYSFVNLIYIDLDRVVQRLLCVAFSCYVLIL